MRFRGEGHFKRSTVIIVVVPLPLLGAPFGGGVEGAVMVVTTLGLILSRVWALSYERPIRGVKEWRCSKGAFPFAICHFLTWLVFVFRCFYVRISVFMFVFVLLCSYLCFFLCIAAGLPCTGLGTYSDCASP